jgi:hypothetical protein
MGLNVILPLLGGLAVVAVLAVVILMKNRTAYLGPVREELQKEKAWLRRGESNAAMVRGRQNLELLLKLVAEKNGIRLDNSAKAQEEAERQNQNRGKKTPQVMTHHQFNRWLSENGYIDRLARWELNQVRVIGNKAVHENYADKDDAWNQFNYLEDVLKTITERSQNPKKRQEQVKQQKQESAQPDQAPKKKKRRKKKSAQPKQNAPEIKETAAVEVQKPKQVKKAQTENVPQEAPQEEQAVEKKKPRRRRRRKKSQNPQNPQVQTEAVKPAKSESKKPEPKKAEPEKELAVTNEGEQKANPHKRRRRRRPRKPQTAQEQNSSGE